MMVFVTCQEERQHDSHPITIKVDKNQIATQLIIVVLYAGEFSLSSYLTSDPCAFFWGGGGHPHTQMEWEADPECQA